MSSNPSSNGRGGLTHAISLTLDRRNQRADHVLAWKVSEEGIKDLTLWRRPYAEGKLPVEMRDEGTFLSHLRGLATAIHGEGDEDVDKSIQSIKAWAASHSELQFADLQYKEPRLSPIDISRVGLSASDLKTIRTKRREFLTVLSGLWNTYRDFYDEKKNQYSNFSWGDSPHEDLAIFTGREEENVKKLDAFLAASLPCISQAYGEDAAVTILRKMLRGEMEEKDLDEMRDWECLSDVTPYKGDPEAPDTAEGRVARFTESLPRNLVSVECMFGTR